MNEKQTESIAKESVVLSQSLRPTKKQKELLDYIDVFIAEHGYSPSYREIMNGLQYTSVATVALHVGNLIKRGQLRKRDHSARSLEVVRQGHESAPVEYVKTNGLKVAEEKWLVSKVEQFFHDAEEATSVEQTQLDNLYILIGALRVLGLEGAAQSFVERLTGLRAQLAQHSTVG